MGISNTFNRNPSIFFNINKKKASILGIITYQTFPVPSPHFLGTAKEGRILSFLSFHSRELCKLCDFCGSESALLILALVYMHEGSCIGLAAAVCWCHLLGMSCHWPFLRADGSADWHTIKTTQPAWFIHTSERQNKAKCTWAMQVKDEKATNDPMQVYIMQQFESNRENNWLSTLDLYFQQIEHFKWGLYIFS